MNRYFNDLFFGVLHQPEDLGCFKQLGHFSLSVYLEAAAFSWPVCHLGITDSEFPCPCFIYMYLKCLDYAALCYSRSMTLGLYNAFQFSFSISKRKNNITNLTWNKYRNTIVKLGACCRRVLQKNCMFCVEMRGFSGSKLHSQEAGMTRVERLWCWIGNWVPGEVGIWRDSDLKIDRLSIPFFNPFKQK